MAPEGRRLTPLLERLEQQAKLTARPSGCMPVFEALLLDELLTRLRRIADNKVAFVSPTDELAALRALSADQLWEVNRQMLLHLDDMTSSLKQQVGPEDMTLLERAVGLTHRRQGWHYLVAQEAGGSILISLDQRHVLQVLGTHETLLEVARRQTHPQAELPLLLFATLLPLKTRDEGWVIAHDGLLACLLLPDPERQTLGAQLRRRYDEARNTLQPAEQPHATAEEQWRPAELTAAGVPPPPPRDSLAGTRAVVCTIPTRLALHPTLKNKLVPHPLVTLAL